MDSYLISHRADGARLAATAFLVMSIFLISGCAMHASSASSPRAVVEAKFAAVNRHDIAGIVELYATDAKVTASNFCKPRHGRADVQRTYQTMFEAFPDIVADIHEYLEQGDRVVVRFTVRGRLPGKTFDLPIANFFTVRNGLIQQDDGVFDTAGRPCSP